MANATADELKQYNAWYADLSGEKVIYLTFDAGYENGNTPSILDALKKHQVPAAFFVVGNYLETSPDLVKRMISEGHIVANHTYHHPDMSKISDRKVSQKSSQASKHSTQRSQGDHAEILPAAPGKIQQSESSDGKGSRLSDLLLESRLCGLVSG